MAATLWPSSEQQRHMKIFIEETSSLSEIHIDGKTFEIELFLGCIHSLDWATGLEHWTGLLDSHKSWFTKLYNFMACSHDTNLNS